MDDQDILDLYDRRDEKAIEITQQQYGIYCRSIAERILRQHQDSEECVNDTWLRAWNAIPPTKPLNLRCFLGKITRNLALNRRREQNAFKRNGDVVETALGELTESLSDQYDPEKASEDRIIIDTINSFLETLKPEKRIMFLMRYWSLYPVSKIAFDLRMSESKVKTTLFRLRKQLKLYLEQEGIQV